MADLQAFIVATGGGAPPQVTDEDSGIDGGAFDPDADDPFPWDDAGP